MMASWDLQPLAEALPRLPVPLHLLHGLRDTTVAPAQSERVQCLVPGSTLVPLPALGHLAPEEDAAGVCQAMAAAVRAAIATSTARGSTSGR